MKRRKFIELVAITAGTFQAGPAMSGKLARIEYEYDGVDDYIKLLKPSRPSPEVEGKFWDLWNWMIKTHWIEYISSITALDLSGSREQVQAKLNVSINNVNNHPGFEDFGGVKLIEPGRPSMSLLYHALASPRVKPKLNENKFQKDQYPEIELLDVLENYIYSLQVFEYPLNKLPHNYVLALFAYEYRPAYKTPDSVPYADHVYSRTGIARIGNRMMSYDAENRCFTNRPSLEVDIKNIAVTPARFGLFLAQMLPCNKVNIYSEENRDYYGFSPFIRQRSFLQPVRKIFDFDVMSGVQTIIFHESHINEKLHRLVKFSGIDIPSIFKNDIPPFIKRSLSTSELDSQAKGFENLVKLIKVGSSVLLNSVPGNLISVATQQGKIVSFKVNKVNGEGFKSDRRYTSLKLLKHKINDIIDFVKTEGLYPKYKATRFSAPRNAPMFVNIRNEVSNDNTSYTNLGPQTPDFEKKIYEGGYQTVLFEDNICEGCVTATIIAPENEIPYQLKILPSFSLATAPDFFPLADSYDLIDYDRTKDSSFLEGGVENLSYCRLGPNPAITNPLTNLIAFPYRKTTNTTEYQEKDEVENSFAATNLEFQVSDTMLAILSSPGEPTNANYKGKADYQQPQKRDYDTTSYLSDTSAFVFAPGWEATYSSLESDIKRVFLATFGLGSPFPEDMKLCAAANGMWPVASPDAARTFQGSLQPLPTPKSLFKLSDETVPPTAIPLMDSELGIHKGYPGLSDPTCGVTESYGWDGEQGPFLEKVGQQFKVNFTDIGRADYVENLINSSSSGFNMELLRNLKCKDLINRIECLRKCKSSVEGNQYRYSKLWLVSAEYVNDWALGAKASGIPIELIGKDKTWIQRPQKKIAGSGYLYVFVSPVYEHKRRPENYQWIDAESKRRYLNIINVIACQVTKDAITWCKIPPGGLKDAKEIEWKEG